MRRHLEFVQLILDSNLLTEKDYDYISLNHVAGKPRDKAIHNERSSIIFIYAPVVVAIISILLTYFHITSYYFGALFAISAIVLMKFFSSKISIFKNLFAVKSSKRLKDYLHRSEEFRSAITKSLRFIQEMEIAAMGYTLVSSKTQINRLSKLRQGLMRDCLQLRHQILISCVDMVLHFREITLKMMNQYNGSDLKFLISLCQIPLEDLGPCFNKQKGLEELTEETDNFCLEILRDTVQFMRDQQSEFLKVLSMAVTRNEESNRNVADVLEHLTMLCKDHTVKIAEVHEMHRNMSGDQSDAQHRTGRVEIQKTTLSTAMHSAQIHLRAGLQVAIQGEECLVNSTDPDFLKDHLLPQLKIHVNACDQCIAEAFKYYEPKHADTPSLEMPTKSKLDDLNRNGNIKVDDSLLDPNDNFSEDQVFEALVDTEMDTLSENLEDDEELGKTRKKRIEETKHVMNELQSVLHLKTSAEEREIRKTKLFPTYVPKIVARQQEDTSNDDVKEYVILDKPEDANLADKCEELDKHKTSREVDSFAGDGDLPPTSHKVLRVPRRLPAPNRPMRKPPQMRKSSRIFELSKNQDDENDHSSDEEDNFNKGAVRLGFGFPSLLASQAVRVALSANLSDEAKCDAASVGFGLAGAEATFGDSDSDS